MTWLVGSPKPLFLTHDEVPANRLVRIGDCVHVTTGREVERIGYRLTTAALRGDVEALIRTPACFQACEALAAACGLRSVSGVAAIALRHAIARMLLQAKRYGGPDRGAVVNLCTPHTGLVVEKRTAQVGAYYPGGGSADDYECGGLHPRKTVVLVRVAGFGWAFSGDTVPAEVTP